MNLLNCFGWWGRGFLILCCSGIGWSAAKQNHNRISQLETSQNLVIDLISQLGYTLKPAEELIRELASEERFSKLPYLNFFANAKSEELLPFPQRWKQAVRAYPGELSQEEKKLVEQIGDIVGAYDLQAQLEQLRCLSHQMGQVVQKLQAQEERSRTLCTSLGPLAGIALAILL